MRDVYPLMTLIIPIIAVAGGMTLAVVRIFTQARLEELAPRSGSRPSNGASIRRSFPQSPPWITTAWEALEFAARTDSSSAGSSCSPSVSG